VATKLKPFECGTRVASILWDVTVRVWDIASSTEILCYDAGTYDQKVEFSDDSSMILVNGDSLSIPPHIPLPGITAGPPAPHPNLPVSKLGIRGDWVTSSSQRIL